MSLVTASEQANAMRYSQGDLAILSAETYDSGLPFLSSPPRTAAATKKARQSTVNSSVSQDGPRKRAKRQSPDSGGEREDEEKKRSRGRPRLDIKDETAADRRRTQIRLAQRAYRNRKENAIQTLERRVQELKDTNEEMSNAFMRLHDWTVNNGLVDQAPEFGRQLRSTTEKFLTLARLSSEEGGKLDDPEGSSVEEHPSRPDDNQPQRESSTPENPPSKPSQQLYGGLILTHEPMSQSDSADDHDLTLSDFSSTIASLTHHHHQQPQPPSSTSHSHSQTYEIITQPTLENASFPFPLNFDLDLDLDLSLPPTTTQSQSQSQSSPFTFSLPPTTTTAPFTPSPLSYTPSPTISYAPSEATFGRRLQRTGCERALVLLTMANPPARRFNRVFGFCLLVESKEAIYRRLVRGVNKTGGESLSYWGFPFYNLGGAGMNLGNGGNGLGGAGGGQEGERRRRVGNEGMVDVMKPAVLGGSGNGGDGNSNGDGGQQQTQPGYNMGPFTPRITEVRDKLLDSETMHISPSVQDGRFGGEFFDCDEVELYLHQRGVSIPPAADFITVEVDAGHFMNDTGVDSLDKDRDGPPTFVGGLAQGMAGMGAGGGNVNRARSPLSSSVSSGETLAVSEPDDSSKSNTAAWALGGVDPMLGGMGSGTPVIEFGMGSNETGAQIMGFHRPSLAGNRKMVTVDVNLLVYELTERTVCLGRTPGIKQEDINTAFWRASHVIA